MKPLIWAGAIISGWIIFYILSSINTGLGMIYTASSKSENDRRNFVKLINASAMQSIFVCLVSTLILSAQFHPLFKTLSEIFHIPIMLAFFTLFIREIAMQIRIRTHKQKAKTTKPIQKLCDYVICESSAISLLCFSCLCTSILSGVPFYKDNLGTLSSFFSFTKIFTFTSLVWVGLFFTSAIAQGTIFALNHFTLPRLRKICIVSLILFSLSIISATIGLSQIEKTWLNTTFDTRIFQYILCPIPAFTLCFVLKNKMKLALILNSTCIALIIITFALMMFPYFLPSTLDLSQSMTIWNSQG